MKYAVVYQAWCGGGIASVHDTIKEASAALRKIDQYKKKTGCVAITQKAKDEAKNGNRYRRIREDILANPLLLDLPRMNEQQVESFTLCLQPKS